MAWTFYIGITNDKKPGLEVMESQLYWGYWDTDSKEDKGLQSIKVGEAIRAFNVKSAFGPNGYKFSCLWKDANQTSKILYGGVSLYTNMSYNASMESSQFLTNESDVNEKWSTSEGSIYISSNGTFYYSTC
ncbi:hypothetical protein [Metasolibacillus meyeri]|uniref:hypothetical protein n=1 Tax=Metasolibacillus meyeri TaxID=1071052 RepID=UPI000D2F9231|nr:hypothetical protein [Metasolibacillus meyeri]